MKFSANRQPFENSCREQLGFQIPASFDTGGFGMGDEILLPS